MSSFRSPATVSGAILGVRDILDTHISKNPHSANKIDSLVVLNAALTDEDNKVLKDYIFKASQNKVVEQKWTEKFTPEHITINDRQILTNKKVAKVSKAMHGAFNSAVILAEPNPNSPGTNYFSAENEAAVKEKIKTAFNEIDGLSAHRMAKSDLKNQVEFGLLSATNDQKLTRDLISKVENEITNDKTSKLDANLKNEKSSQHSHTNDNSLSY